MKKLVIIIFALIVSANAFSQASNAINSSVGAAYLGFFNAGDLPFKMVGTQYMLLDNTANPGYFGIGTAFSPNFKLDVDQGDININTATNAYRINGNAVLWHKVNPTNIFVGVGSGTANTTGSNNTFVGNNSGNANVSAWNNTFMGYNAGTANLTGSANTFVGAFAGASNTSAYDNAFFGANAGRLTTGGIYNVFVGADAGWSNSTGNQNTYVGYLSGTSSSNTTENTFVGCQAGENTTTGNQNTFLGEESGQNNNTGNINVFVGHQAGINTKSDANTFIGEQAALANSTGVNNSACGHLSGATNSGGNYNTFLGAGADVLQDVDYSSAIGFNAKVNQYYNMILGGDSTLVGIGMTGTTFPLGPQAKLHVENDATNLTSQPMPFGSTFASSIGGIFNTSGTNSLTTYYMGVVGASSVKGPLGNYGGRFTASNCQRDNAGVFTTSFGSTGVRNFGIYANANNSVSNFGVYALAGPIAAITYPGAANIALYGNCKSNAVGTPPIPVSNFAGFLDGDFWVNGIPFTTNAGLWTLSDQMFKTHIDSIPNASNIVSRLKPKMYYLDTANAYGINFAKEKQFGLIAEDVYAVAPELTKQFIKPADVDSAGNVVHASVSFKALNYTEMIPLLIAAFKEQKHSTDSTIAALQNQINNCCNSNHSHGANYNPTNPNNDVANTDVKLSDAQNVVLDQNQPNPFSEQTTIGYSLPDNTTTAQMLFYNASGRLIKSLELTNKGKGQVNVFAEDLTNGIYTYTLVVDGKIFETKKMVKQ
jgi:hypothetical protein